MKKRTLLLMIFALCSCSSLNSEHSISGSDTIVSSTQISNTITPPPSISNESSATTHPSISNNTATNPSLNDTTSISKPNSQSSITSSNDSSGSNVCDSSYRPGGNNPDGSARLPIPCNKNNKIVLGSDNASMTTFDFSTDLPEDFRFIYGNNFTNPSFYSETAGGGVKISSATNAKQGIQTAMFTTNLKLEIRIHIGELFKNSHGNNIDKNKPVIVIYAFDENGNYLRSVEIDEVTENNKNSHISKYMDGTNVAYLEIRALQFPYKGSQAYNFSLKGISLIAWPYPL